MNILNHSIGFAFFCGFSIIFFLFNTLVVAYLVVYHTRIILHNETTYELKRRQKIKYLPASLSEHDHPFDNGLLSNLKEVFMASGRYPKEWPIPERPKSHLG